MFAGFSQHFIATKDQTKNQPNSPMTTQDDPKRPKVTQNDPKQTETLPSPQKNLRQIEITLNDQKRPYRCESDMTIVWREQSNITTAKPVMLPKGERLIEESG